MYLKLVPTLIFVGALAVLRDRLSSWTTADAASVGKHTDKVEEGFLRRSIRAVVSDGPTGRQTIWRIFFVSLLAMALCFSLAENMLRDARDISETPWVAYHEMFGTLLSITQNQAKAFANTPDKLADVIKLQRLYQLADNTGLAITYTALLVVTIVCVNFVSIYTSLLLSDAVFDAFADGAPLIQRLMMLLAVCVVSLFLGFLILASVGLLTNPTEWACLVLARSFHLNVGWQLICWVSAVLAGLYLEGAWLRSLVASALLPVLLFIGILGASLIRALRHHWASRLQEHDSLQATFMALAIGWFLYRVLKVML